MRLVRDDRTGRREARIVEVEAYGGPEDRASHARFASTARNQAMAGPPGSAYVYLVYGMYDCLNVVTGPVGQPSAVLIRAVEPLLGIDQMRAQRLAWGRRRRVGRTEVGAAAAKVRLDRVPDHRLASGPGLVGAAFGIDTGWTGIDLCDASSPLRLEGGDRGAALARASDAIAVGPRIGVAYADEPWASRAWRFSIAGHRSVSGPRPRTTGQDAAAGVRPASTGR